MTKKIFIFFTMLILLGCSNSKKKTPRLISMESVIQISVDSTDNFDFEDNSRIIFKLWGYDKTKNNSKPILLKTYDYNLLKLPVTYGLDYKIEKWDKKISKDKKAKFGYYVTIEPRDKYGNKYKVYYLNTKKDYLFSKKTKLSDLSEEVYIKK